MKKIYLNQELIKKQKLPDSTVLEIENLHRERIKLEQRMRRSKNIPTLRRQWKEWEQIQFKLQELWGFTLDSAYHRGWQYLPHCSCPKMDNDDPIFFGRKVINSDCKLHGWEEENGNY